MALNRLTLALGEACRHRPTEPKLLVAPALRTGYQWLDAVAASGRPVVNVQVTTLAQLARRAADPALERDGLTMLGACRAEVILAGILDRLRREGAGYLTRLEPNRSLLGALRRSIEELRLAGLSADALRSEDFEHRDKAREIRRIIGHYERELAAGRLVDRAAVLRLALERVEAEPGFLPERVLLLPEELQEELGGLERRFWEHLPAEIRVSLPGDLPGEPPNGWTAWDCCAGSSGRPRLRRRR